MRTIEYSTIYKRDYRRAKANPQHRNLDDLLAHLLELLTIDRPLLPSKRDHALSGNWISYRECHVRPDLLLIYRKVDANILQLVRLGSHSELF